MHTINISDLTNNLNAYLEQVRNGEEILVKDRDQPIARLMPPLLEEVVDAEEAALVAMGILRLPTRKKSNALGKGESPNVTMADVTAVIRAERNED